jgi:ABC-2 type transport system ATP-binding protein
MNHSETASTSAKAAGVPMIEAVGLSKFYGVFAAARDVTFTIRKGELVAFLGPNGAGKSTTMKMLTGYSRLGYLPENGPLYPDETPYSLLEFFADARGMNPQYKKERIGAVIDLCALGSVIHKPISKLSKGFRQRVGMAHALLHEPDVLIMDEPTAGLDPNQIVEVRKTLMRIAEEKTILLSTHILQEVEAMAQRVIMINEGRLVYDGAAKGLIEKYDSLDKAFHKLTAATAPVAA